MNHIKQNIKLPIQWTALEYEYRKKGSEWIWYTASASLLIITISILLHNFLLGIFAIAAAFAVIIVGNKKPRKIKFIIDAKGIKIDQTFYPFKKIKSFWLNYDPPAKKELVIEQDSKLIPHIKMPISHIDPNMIRNFLVKMLPEKEYEETLTEIIMDRIGF